MLLQLLNLGWKPTVLVSLIKKVGATPTSKVSRIIAGRFFEIKQVTEFHCAYLFVIIRQRDLRAYLSS
jgi:hypothetical protein